MTYEDYAKRREKELVKQKFWKQIIGSSYFGHINGWEWRWYPNDQFELPKEMPTEGKVTARKEISELKKTLTKVRREFLQTSQDPKLIYERLLKEEKARNTPMTYIEQMKMLVASHT